MCSLRLEKRIHITSSPIITEMNSRWIEHYFYRKLDTLYKLRQTNIHDFDNNGKRWRLVYSYRHGKFYNLPVKSAYYKSWTTIYFNRSRSITSCYFKSVNRISDWLYRYLSGSSYWFSIDYKFNLRDWIVGFSVYLPQTDWLERITTIITLFNFVSTGRTSSFTALIAVKRIFCNLAYLVLSPRTFSQIGGQERLVEL